MVDVLPNISDHFRERFLDTHLDYLHSILYIIQKMYFEKDESPPEAMLNKILKQRPKIHKIKKDSPFETSEFRNLRNCWYNECALNYPFDSLDERMKFASWKIMQCYYTRALTLSALVFRKCVLRKSEGANSTPLPPLSHRKNLASPMAFSPKVTPSGSYMFKNSLMQRLSATNLAASSSDTLYRNRLSLTAIPRTVISM
jgi:hypothetical protein